MDAASGTARRPPGWGRELSDQRLRAVAVAWAEAIVRLQTESRLRHPLRWRLARALLVLGAAAYLAFAAAFAARGEWEPLGRLAVYALVFGAPAVLVHRGPRRAIERNSGPPPQR